MAGGLSVSSEPIGRAREGRQSKLAILRRGIPMHKRVTLGNGENSMEVVVVLLSSDDMLDIEGATEEYCKRIGDKCNRIVRNNYYNRLLCALAMRDPDDVTYNTLLVDDADEVGEFMDVEDMERVCSAYKELLQNKAPKMELINETELEEIKNFLRVTPLKDLSTTLLVHLKSCHRTIVSEK